MTVLVQIGSAVFERPASAEHMESRQFYATVGRWMLFVWGSLGAVGGLLVLTGVLHCG